MTDPITFDRDGKRFSLWTQHMGTLNPSQRATHEDLRAAIEAMPFDERMRVIPGRGYTDAFDHVLNRADRSEEQATLQRDRAKRAELQVESLRLLVTILETKATGAFAIGATHYTLVPVATVQSLGDTVRRAPVVQASTSDAKQSLDAVALALHPHWSPDGRNGYCAEQLPGMVRLLRDRAEAAELLVAEHLEYLTRPETTKMAESCCNACSKGLPCECTGEAVAPPESAAPELEPGRFLLDECERHGVHCYGLSARIAAVESACIERGRREAETEAEARLAIMLADKDRELAELRLVTATDETTIAELECKLEDAQSGDPHGHLLGVYQLLRHPAVDVAGELFGEDDKPRYGAVIEAAKALVEELNALTVQLGAQGQRFLDLGLAHGRVEGNALQGYTAKFGAVADSLPTNAEDERVVDGLLAPNPIAALLAIVGETRPSAAIERARDAGETSWTCLVGYLDEIHARLVAYCKAESKS